MFNRPSIGAAEEDAVLGVLRSGWLTTGPRTKALEERFAAFRSCAHAVGVNSCTAALHLCLVCLGVGPGDEVDVADHVRVYSQRDRALRSHTRVLRRPG